MSDSGYFRAELRALAELILKGDASPYEPALEILGLASSHRALEERDDVWAGHVRIWGELTDQAESEPGPRVDQAEARMVDAAREWLAVEGDPAAELRYLDRWVHDILGFERRPDRFPHPPFTPPRPSDAAAPPPDAPSE